MGEPSFGEHVATLNSTLRAIEVRLALGKAPVEGLEDFKSALDDMRLRLWGLLGTAGGDDYKNFPGALPDSPGHGDVPGPGQRSSGRLGEWPLRRAQQLTRSCSGAGAEHRAGTATRLLVPV